MAPESARVVHLAPLPPEGTGAVSALCGALLRPEEHDTVRPGHGMPCSLCVLSHAQSGDMPAQAPDDADPQVPDDAEPTGPADLCPAASPDPASPEITPGAAARGYQSWGWPVVWHRDQVWLTLDRNVLAVLVPTLLAVEVTALLARRDRAPAVLVHPDVPEHLVLLGGEPYGITLPWPPGVHRITGSVLLSPTATTRGALSWVHPPAPDSLRSCREIDLIAALRAVLRDPPSASGPMHF
jgi:hypothetical protein